MNVLFMTLVGINSLQEKGIYTDLLREFEKHKHSVCVISPVERRYHEDTRMIVEGNTRILRLKIGNTQKTNVVEKGISTVMIEPAFKKALKQYFSDIKFDLVLYSTPPITLTSAIEYVKRRDGARTYLLLKDIFPQNAVDIGLLTKRGVKSLLYSHFRRQEKKLYKISDRIGCMSQANVDYVVKHNPEINPAKVEVCPNCIEVTDKSVNNETRAAIRNKYDIPSDRKVFIYGGNLGKPQGIPFIIECLRKCKDVDDALFLIVGDGTEYAELENYAMSSKQQNLKLMKRLPKEDYDNMVGACDVGMIFLDHRFTIPNFPSRLLSYMQSKLPVLAVTDSNTDIGKTITEGGFGWWCESVSPDCFYELVEKIISSDLNEMGERGYSYLQEHYNTAKVFTELFDNE